MQNWTVYRHTSPSSKVYVGITTNLKERWSNFGAHYCTYNSIFKNAINKYGWNNIQHEVLLEGISKKEAEYAERYLIKWYKTHNMSYNITEGGEGTLGRKDSEETKNRKRVSNLGKTRTLEQRDRISKAHKTEHAVSISRKNIEKAHDAWKGQHHSNETKRKLSEKAKGRDMTALLKLARIAPRNLFTRPVLQIDFNNNVIKEFLSIAEANRALGKTSNSIMNCLSGRAKSAFGYRWRYKN